jgi:hypothetical protein
VISEMHFLWCTPGGGLGADNLLLGAMFICSGMFDEPKLQKKIDLRN